MFNDIIKSFSNDNIFTEDDALFCSIINKNPFEMISLIKKGYNLNAIDFIGDSYLHIAAGMGNSESVKILIYKHIPVNIKNKQDNTPAHYAINEDKISNLNILLNNDANIDSRDKYGNTLLHYACLKNNIEIVNNLIERQANIDAINDEGRSSLFYSILNNNYLIMKILIENGASLKIFDNNNCDISKYLTDKDPNIIDYLKEKNFIK